MLSRSKRIANVIRQQNIVMPLSNYSHLFLKSNIKLKVNHKKFNNPIIRFFSTSGNGQDYAGPGKGAWVNPDNVPKGENLKKFSRDLTLAASENKLDPVIGR